MFFLSTPKENENEKKKGVGGGKTPILPFLSRLFPSCPISLHQSSTL
jgi:hypothetical protein